MHDTERRLVQAFAAELRTRRRAADLSQEELADQAGVHRTYVSALERGLKNPTLYVLFRLSGVLGVAPSDFVRAVMHRFQDFERKDAFPNVASDD